VRKVTKIGRGKIPKLWRIFASLLPAPLVSGSFRYIENIIISLHQLFYFRKHLALLVTPTWCSKARDVGLCDQSKKSDGQSVLEGFEWVSCCAHALNKCGVYK
jgi:hypothetical protein